MQRKQWHIFCRVVDNFGDIGVCWRLAKQLVREHQLVVTLWVDDLVSFQALCPQAQCVALQQQAGVQVRHWTEPFQAIEALQDAQVVIEAFACELPLPVLAQLQRTQPLWLNLEYLSAESWVDGVHGLPSPVNGMMKIFFCPGFTAHTGGLLWEEELFALAARYAQSAARRALYLDLGLAAELADCPLRISMFAYENAQLAGLLTALSRSPQAVHLLVPTGRIHADLEAWLGEPIAPGQILRRGQLVISCLPFIEQSQYDALLASCTVNFVRGEESFVRAQMLGLPFIWHIYQQQENAHLEKLDAFLLRYLADCPEPLAQAIGEAFRAWNSPTSQPIEWLQLFAELATWQQQANAWQAQMRRLGSLATNLVHYSQNRL